MEKILKRWQNLLNIAKVEKSKQEYIMMNGKI